MKPIYSTVNYQMGDVAPPSSSEVAAAEAKLRLMNRTLREWLKYRLINDRLVAGRAPKAVLARPGVVRTSRSVLARELAADRGGDEQKLADLLHGLLSETFDAAKLPSPNLRANPRAAVQLAQIAVSGKLPGDTVAPAEQGLIWMWPAVIVVGAVLFTVTTAIRSQADVAKEKERLRCVREGACTDSGFWLKIGGIAVAGWVLWDKMGLRQRVEGALKK